MSSFDKSDGIPAPRRAFPDFPPNPDYGSGFYRRRIRLTRRDGHVQGELDDDPHAMRCRIDHDGRTVTGVEADFHHYPLNHCPGAAEPLRRLIGMPLATPVADFFAGGRARANCTHMLDLAWLAIRHAGRSQTVRTYAIDVPDERDGRRAGRLERDGALCLQWLAEHDRIISPGVFSGRDLFDGFVRWAVATLDGDLFEAALVFQKGFFVAGARQHLIPPGPLAPWEADMLGGVCFGFGKERIETAERGAKGRRDFTHHPERLLTFR